MFRYHLNNDYMTWNCLLSSFDTLFSHFSCSSDFRCFIWTTRIDVVARVLSMWKIVLPPAKDVGRAAQKLV
jgi:hypothetical protein